MIRIDGSFGEGGGQILRTSLTLSLIKGQPFEIYNIRARRKNPGLQPQHLKCIEAATRISKGKANGDKKGSLHLIFEPGEVIPGDYHFEIGTAGSTSLVLQTIFLPLALAKIPSRVTISGGTHVSWSPVHHFLSLHWLPYLAKIGFNLKLKMDRAGFYPQGDGRISAEIFPAENLKPIEMVNRGDLKTITGISAVANLDYSIAERQRSQALKRLEQKGYDATIAIENMPSRYKNTMMLLLADFEQGSGCFTALGAIGKRAEQVADEAVDDLFEYLDSSGCIDKYLADQLVVPLAIIPGKSLFSTAKITNHFLTNISVVKQFLNIQSEVQGQVGEHGIVKISGGLH
ncbi:MAG TPA: RNA 3'-terminal phosphate cyclase [bacterium]